jgi:ribonuclease HII
MMRARATPDNRQSHNKVGSGSDPRKVPAPASGRPSSARERGFWRSGYRLVGGIDEVGRGAWAGPLSVGVVVLTEPLARWPRGLRDSKQILEHDRERLFDKVAGWCAAWAVGHAQPEECDLLGMTAGLVLATRRALAKLPLELLPEAVLLDGKFDFVTRACSLNVPTEHEEEDTGPLVNPALAELLARDDAALPSGFAPVVETLVKADSRCVSVAAASVLAKVTRDRLMRSCANSFPAFDFERNKGYPSPTHKLALRGYGLSAIHRRSWIFVEGVPWADPYRSVPCRGLFVQVAEDLTEGAVVAEDLTEGAVVAEGLTEGAAVAEDLTEGADDALAESVGLVHLS